MYSHTRPSPFLGQITHCEALLNGVHCMREALYKFIDTIQNNTSVRVSIGLLIVALVKAHAPSVSQSVSQSINRFIHCIFVREGSGSPLNDDLFQKPKSQAEALSVYT